MENIWRYTFFEIDNENLPKLMELGSLLMNENKKEALKTLAHEHADFEALYLERGPRKSQVIGAMHFYDKPVKADPKNPLNQKHQRILRSILKKTGSLEGDAFPIKTGMTVVYSLQAHF